MDKFFMLTVAIGAIIHASRQRPETVTGLPEDAQERWEKGDGLILLKKDGAEILEKYSEEKLNKIQKLRAPLNFEAENLLLETAINKKSKTKPEEPAKAEKK